MARWITLFGQVLPFTMAAASYVLVLAMLADGVLSKTHTVTFSDAPTWTVGVGVAYPDLEITLGETLSFTSYSAHDVVLLHSPSSGTHWDQCGMGGIQSGSFTTVWATTDFAAVVATEKHYTPPSCGDFYMACSVGPHCVYGQRSKVTVSNGDGSACASPCVGAGCVTADAKNYVTNGVVHHLKPAPNSQYWGTWGSYDALTVNVGDSILFQTGAGFHDVATVPTLAALGSCDMSGKTVVADWDSAGVISTACNSSSSCCASSSCGSSEYRVTYNFTAESVGDTYFVCSVVLHCQTGQKFTLTAVEAATSTSIARRSPVYYYCLTTLALVAVMR